jgi:hypothetical protein
MVKDGKFRKTLNGKLRCGRCLVWLPKSSFNRYRSNSPKLRGRCKRCEYFHHNARKRTRWAIKVGLLKRGKCEVCGSPRVFAHHGRYAYWYKVRWMCPTHHALYHLNKEVKIAARKKVLYEERKRREGKFWRKRK